MAFEPSPRISVLLSRLTDARAGYLDELAAGNLPSDIDDILTNIAALNDISTAQVNTEVDTGLSDIDLDHLIQVAHPSGDPVADSLMDLIMNKGAGQTFARATDSLEALSEAITALGGGDATEAKQDTIIALLDPEIADILADTNELQVSLANGGFTDLLIDSIIERTANLPDDPADASVIATAHGLLATEAKQDIIDTNVDDIETDTNEIQTSLADGGFTDLLIDSIISDLGDGTYGLSALDTDLGTLLTRLSAARAGYLDNLIGAETAGTYNHPDGVVEQDAVEITPAELSEYFEMCLDLNALTKVTYVRTYVKVDGATYRQMDYAEYPTDYPADTEAITVLLPSSSEAIKVTLESAEAEGAIRAAPYFYVRRSIT